MPAVHPRKALAPKHGDADGGQPGVPACAFSFPGECAQLAPANSAAHGAPCGGAETRASPPRPGVLERERCP